MPDFQLNSNSSRFLSPFMRTANTLPFTQTGQPTDPFLARLPQISGTLPEFALRTAGFGPDPFTLGVPNSRLPGFDRLDNLQSSPFGDLSGASSLQSSLGGLDLNGTSATTEPASSSSNTTGGTTYLGKEGDTHRFKLSNGEEVEIGKDGKIDHDDAVALLQELDNQNDQMKIKDSTSRSVSSGNFTIREGDGDKESVDRTELLQRLVQGVSDPNLKAAASLYAGENLFESGGSGATPPSED